MQATSSSTVRPAAAAAAKSWVVSGSGPAGSGRMSPSKPRTRPGDQLYRIGGDEFAMLLPGTDVHGALDLTRRLLHMAWRPYAGVRPSPFSAGITAAPLFGRDPELLYRQADAALYWVKRHGRGAVDVFEPERDQLPDTLEDATRAAIQEVLIGRLLVPVFQPIVDLRTGRILGFEGLIRPDPSSPLRDTAQLFAAASACGRIVELDVACIEQVLSAARAIGPERLLTLNLSPRTLEVRDFDAGWLLQGLYRNGISPGRVIVELTERDEIDDLARLKRTFQHLRQYGLRVAADDVGAGNAGLRLLSQVQFDIVKLDLSLVQDGVRRMGARSVLQSLRDLALDQHAHVVAEGVETAEQLNVLRDLQIRAGQGYLLGRPGASVAGTFVDVDTLSDSHAVPASTAQLAFATPGLVLGDGKAPQTDVAGQDVRAIILPTPRLGGLVGTSPGAA
jgi:EAL domain-containing protein (putative c-di-GMP-specific phosphodiesterase class I)